MVIIECKDGLPLNQKGIKKGSIEKIKGKKFYKFSAKIFKQEYMETIPEAEAKVLIEKYGVKIKKESKKESENKEK